jgi:hypothetical protein
MSSEARLAPRVIDHPHEERRDGISVTQATVSTFDRELEPGAVSEDQTDGSRSALVKVGVDGLHVPI